MERRGGSCDHRDRRERGRAGDGLAEDPRPVVTGADDRGERIAERQEDQRQDGDVLGEREDDERRR